MIRWKHPAAALLLAATLAANPAEAHKVNVFAVAEGGIITGEAYFGGGAKAMNSAIEVYDATGSLAASTVTGADGTFSLPVPAGATPPLRVVLKAGEGHGNDFTLTARDMGQDLGQAPAVTPAATAPSTPAAQAPASAPASVSSAASGAEPAATDAAMARLLDEKLAPLKLELAKITAREESTRMRDIIGGIGWIVGLVGIAAWFKRPGK